MEGVFLGVEDLAYIVLTIDKGVKDLSATQQTVCGARLRWIEFILSYVFARCTGCRVHRLWGAVHQCAAAQRVRSCD